MSAKPTILAVTSGEPAGIGPRLCGALAGELTPQQRIVVLGDERWLRQQIHPAITLRPYAPNNPPGLLEVLHIPLAAPVTPGQPDARNAPAVLDMLARATNGCLDGEFAALITCPVQKSVLCEAGIAFSGHTEYLAARTGASRVVMMFAAERLRVALATTHLPLAAVPAALTASVLRDVLRILLDALTRQFRIAHPRVLVAGLNPHAGEDGHLGDEEQRILTPVLEELRAQGHEVLGPLPADTIFTPRRLEQADAVLAMYHDQGLPPFKYASFGKGVNVTLGLPIIRTSVDHGTALDIAAAGTMPDTGSLLAAVRLAAQLCEAREA
ncbi:MAG: 4-hydroxythreonine-4-phosphate dehydrogenase PdxA [Rhodocyclaceae bacterium]|nr:4-hydroxythreonine-4-phosphate dehydrogenase PdxA [Rhodocyclaceae bacterium]